MGYVLIGISLVVCVFLAWNRAKLRGCVFSAKERRKQILNWLGVSFLLTAGFILLFGSAFVWVWLIISLVGTMIIINIIIRWLWAHSDIK